MKEKFKLVMLPTEKASKIHLCSYQNELRLGNNQTSAPTLKSQHLYFTSDDKIKEGDRFIYYGKLKQCKYIIGSDEDYSVYCDKDIQYFSFDCKKIVATTDTSLKIFITKDDLGDDVTCCLPQIPESFIQTYIKLFNEGKRITEVELEMEQLCCQTGKPCGYPCNGEENCKKSLYIKTNPDNTVIIL